MEKRDRQREAWEEINWPNGSQISFGGSRVKQKGGGMGHGGTNQCKLMVRKSLMEYGKPQDE